MSATQQILASYGAAPFDTVSFVAASGPSFVSGAASINTPSTPPGIANGDGLFAILFARSALTPPAGWTLVASQANVGSVTQTLYVYRKDTVTTGDASTAFNWNQSASGRMGLTYIVARSSNGVVITAGSSSAETDYTASTAYPHTITVPTAAATESGELFLVAAAAELASATAGGNLWSPATGATLRTDTSGGECRLAAFTQGRNTGQSNASPASFNAGSASANYYSAITVRLQAA